MTEQQQQVAKDLDAISKGELEAPNELIEDLTADRKALLERQKQLLDLANNARNDILKIEGALEKIQADLIKWYTRHLEGDNGSSK